MAIAKTLKERQLTIYCDYCFRNITQESYFRCEDCRFDACPECFFQSNGIIEHDNSHSFRVVSNLSKILMCDQWSLLDELLLLDGTISYGFENFDDISKILSSKPCCEIRDHFYQLINVKDCRTYEIERNEVPKSNPNDSYVLSYMSKRKEFDSDLFNEYETIIENLRFSEDDNENEKEFYRNMLYNYKNILKRRKILRNFIFDRNLTDIQGLKEREAAGLGEIANKFKWIAQFLSKNDFNLFISGLLREKELKNALSSFPPLSMIDETNLKDISKLLNKKELELCSKLKLTNRLYIKLKKMALEYYVLKKPLKASLFSLFLDSEIEKANALYKWFLDHNIVFESDL